MTDNPLLADAPLPLFDKIEPAHVVPAVEQMLETMEKQLAALEADVQPTWDGLIERLDDLVEPIYRTWKPVAHLMGVKNSPELRSAYELVLPKIVALDLRIKQSEPIYKALKTLREGVEWEKCNEAQRRVVERKLLEAELAGIGLEGDKRARFNEIERELSKLSTDFSNHVLDSTKAFSHTITDKADVEGIPGSALAMASAAHNERLDGKDKAQAGTPDNGPWRITLSIPSFLPFMQHCRKRELREKLYRAFVQRASQGEHDNAPLITQILKLRKEKAGLLGYKSYADLSLTLKMADTVDAVLRLHEELRAPSWKPAEKDIDDLKALARERGEPDDLKQWDIPFLAERLREKRFDITDEQLRPYFPLPRVLDGLFGVVNKLFGVTVKPADGEAPVWQKDVRFFRIFGEDGNPIAAFYLDPYSRPADKRGGAWMDDCLPRRRSPDGKLQLPVAYLVCNQTPPVGDKPSLMTFREVETLFHEFGHGLQHMLTTVDYQEASGINGVEWDAVELPSQFMENWCYHKPTLLGMTKHVETGSPLPDDLFEKLCAARTYRAGSMLLRQLMFGLTDMELHATYDPTGNESVFDVMRRVAEKTSVLPLLPEDRFLCAFEHIFAGGYAAGYYSYKWAEVLSADAFDAFIEAGLDDQKAVEKTGRRFRDTVLAMGGSKHPMDVFKEFRGREPSTAPLLKQNGLV